VLTGPPSWLGPFALAGVPGFDLPHVAAGTAYFGTVPVGPYFAFTSQGNWFSCRTIFDTLLIAWTYDGTYAGGCAALGFDLGGDLQDSVTGIAIDDPGPIEKTVVAGWARSGPGASSDLAVARLLVNGSVDTGFGSAGKRTLSVDFDASGRDEAHAAAVRADHWIVLAGLSGADDSSSAGVVALLPPDGSASSERVVTLELGGLPTRFDAITLAAGDRVYVAGSVRDANQSDVVVARLRGDLSLDPTFGNGGWTRIDASGADDDDQAVGVALQEGRPVAVGNVSTANNGAWALLRLTSSLVFADGSEGGSTALWSAAAP
jgi:uncharacterized delta-60 repeat protein